MVREPGVDRDAKLEDGDLVRALRRRRHEQLAVHQLVTRRGQRILRGERADLRRRPSAALRGGHAHTLLGSALEMQVDNLARPGGSGVDMPRGVPYLHIASYA